MFQFFRRQDKLVRWFLGGLLLLICLTMLTYLIPGMNTGGDVSADVTVLAKACGEPVTTVDVQQQFDTLNKQQQRPLPTTFLSIYAPQLLKTLTEERILDCEGKRMGLRVSPEEVADRLKSSQGFYPGGEFIGMDHYREIVEQRMGLTVEAFEDQIAKEIMRGKVRHIVTDALVASDGELDAEYHRQNDKVKVSYVVLKADQFSSEVKVDPERMKAFFERTKQNFQIPERRQLKYAVLDMNRVREGTDVTPSEIQAYYDRNRDAYRVKERVHMAQIMVKTTDLSGDKLKEAEKKINDALAQIKKGGDFAAIAKTTSEDPGSADKGGDLPWATKDQISDPNMAKAAFSLQPGQTSDVVKSSFGLHIIKVIEHEQAHQKTLQEVQTDILTKLKAEKAELAKQHVLDQLDAEVRKNPKGLDAVATAMKMGVLSDPGHQRGAPLAALGVSPAADDAIFALKPGEVSGPITIGEQKAIFQVVAVQPPRTPELDEVKDKVESEFKIAEADDLLKKKAQEFADLVKKDGDLAKAAKEKKYEVKTSAEIPMTGRVDEIAVADFPAHAFKMKVGEFTGPLQGNRTQVFYQVDSLTVPNEAETAANRDKVRAQVTEDKRQAYFDVYLSQLRDRMTKEGKLTTNEAAMKRFTALYQQQQ